MVAEPAGLLDRKFQPGLVETIVKDALGQPGYLPLLEFALTELWNRQTSTGLLTFEAYQEIGGVAGALPQRAERLYGEYEKSGQEDVLRRLFVRLVQPGLRAPDTRRRATRQELDTDFRDLDFPIWQVVEHLVDARLVVVDRGHSKTEAVVEILHDPASPQPVSTKESTSTGEETVEIAHEALIRGWSRLGTWVNDDRDFLTWRNSRLGPDLQAWQDEGKDSGNLLRGEPLTTAERWLKERTTALSSSERNYIFSSIMQEESDLDQWMPLFTPQDEVLTFLDGYLSLSSKENDQLKGIAGLKGLKQLEEEAYQRLEKIVLTYPSVRIREQAAETICRRGEVDKLAMLLKKQLDKDNMKRVVHALAFARNLPSVGKQVDDVVDNRNRGKVRRAATRNLISSRRNEFAYRSFSGLLVRHGGFNRYLASNQHDRQTVFDFWWFQPNRGFHGVWHVRTRYHIGGPSVHFCPKAIG